MRSQSAGGASTSAGAGPEGRPETGARPISDRRSLTEVLRPEKLKSREPSLKCGMGKGLCARPRRARRSTVGPPG